MGLIDWLFKAIVVILIGFNVACAVLYVVSARFRRLANDWMRENG